MKKEPSFGKQFEQRKRVILLTDGWSYSRVDIAVQMKNAGTIIDVVGIGGTPNDVNEELLKKIASVIDGKVRYKFIKDSASLVKYYKDELSCAIQKVTNTVSNIRKAR